VSNAVAFLSNPKVKPTPIESKKRFLQERKGLNLHEIEEAFQRVGEDLLEKVIVAPPILQPVTPAPKSEWRGGTFGMFLSGIAAGTAILYSVQAYLSHRKKVTMPQKKSVRLKLDLDEAAEENALEMPPLVKKDKSHPDLKLDKEIAAMKKEMITVNKNLAEQTANLKETLEALKIAFQQKSIDSTPPRSALKSQGSFSSEEMAKLKLENHQLRASLSAYKHATNLASSSRMHAADPPALPTWQRESSFDLGAVEKPVVNNSARDPPSNVE